MDPHRRLLEDAHSARRALGRMGHPNQTQRSGEVGRSAPPWAPPAQAHARGGLGKDVERVAYGGEFTGVPAPCWFSAARWAHDLAQSREYRGYLALGHRFSRDCLLAIALIDQEVAYKRTSDDTGWEQIPSTYDADGVDTVDRPADGSDVPRPKHDVAPGRQNLAYTIEIWEPPTGTTASVAHIPIGRLRVVFDLILEAGGTFRAGTKIWTYDVERPGEDEVSTWTWRGSSRGITSEDVKVYAYIAPTETIEFEYDWSKDGDTETENREWFNAVSRYPDFLFNVFMLSRAAASGTYSLERQAGLWETMALEYIDVLIKCLDFSDCTDRPSELSDLLRAAGQLIGRRVSDILVSWHDEVYAE